MFQDTPGLLHGTKPHNQSHKTNTCLASLAASQQPRRNLCTPPLEIRKEGKPNARSEDFLGFRRALLSSVCCKRTFHSRDAALAVCNHGNLKHIGLQEVLEHDAYKFWTACGCVHPFFCCTGSGGWPPLRRHQSRAPRVAPAQLELFTLSLFTLSAQTSPSAFLNPAVSWSGVAASATIYQHNNSMNHSGFLCDLANVRTLSLPPVRVC